MDEFLFSAEIIGSSAYRARNESVRSRRTPAFLDVGATFLGLEPTLFAAPRRLGRLACLGNGERLQQDCSQLLEAILAVPLLVAILLRGDYQLAVDGNI